MSIDEKSNYYDAGGIEVMEIIKSKLTEEQFKGFLLGNSLKYQLRCNWKESFERDIEKSNIYTKLLKNLIENKTKNNDKFYLTEDEKEYIINNIEDIYMDEEINFIVLERILQILKRN